MTVENLLIASYVISALLMGGLSINSYIRMKRAEDVLQDLKDKP